VHGRGIFIVIPLLWEAFAERSESGTRAGIFQSRWWLVLVPAGLISFATYLHVRFGEAMAFLHGQATFHRELTMPWEGLEIASRYPTPYGHFFIGIMIVAVGLSALAFFVRLRMSYCLYAVVFLILCLSTTIWESIPRYLSVIFPFYIALGAATIRSEGLYILAIAITTGLMTVCSILFVCGYFIT
jgi:hypothetical protein